MSLINQVLRDLERREPSMPVQPITVGAPAMPEPPSAAETPLAPEAVSWSSIRDEEDERPRHWQLAGLGLSALLLIGGGAWWLSHGSASQSAAPAAPQAADLQKIASLPVIPDIEPDPKAEVPPLPEPVAAVEPPPAAPPVKPASAAHSATARQAIKAVAAPVKPAPEPKAAPPAPVKPAQAAAAPAAVPRAEQLFLQAQAELKQEQGDAALNSLRAALEADPKHVQARLTLARLLTERKQLPAASDLLADGVMLLPQQNAFVLALAPLWIQSGQQDDAMALLAQSAKQPAATPQLVSYYAAQLLRLKRHAEAATQFRAALRSDPAQSDWLIGLGLSLQGAGQNRDAIDAFRRAYETGKLNPERKDLVEQMIAGLKSRL